MDPKTIQQTLASQRREDAKQDAELAELIQSGEIRAAQFSQNWQAVDFDAFISKFAPNAVRTTNRGKIYYQTPGSDLVVIVDVGGWYCRLYDTKKGMYLGVDGTDVHNYTTARGTQSGRKHGDWLAVTHFRIKKKGEST